MRAAGADNLSLHRGPSSVSFAFRRWMEDCVLAEGCCPSVLLSTLTIWEVWKDALCEHILYSVQTALLWFCVWKWASRGLWDVEERTVFFVPVIRAECSAIPHKTVREGGWYRRSGISNGIYLSFQLDLASAACVQREQLWHVYYLEKTSEISIGRSEIIHAFFPMQWEKKG